MDFLIFAQEQPQSVVSPQVASILQLLGLFAVLGVQAWGMYLQSEGKKETKTAIADVADKTEVVHKALNSQLDAFKKEAAEQYRIALDQGIAIVRLTLEKAADIKTTALEARISSLENKLDSERLKAVALAIAAKSADPVARLEEIRSHKPVD